LFIYLREARKEFNKTLHVTATASRAADESCTAARVANVAVERNASDCCTATSAAADIAARASGAAAAANAAVVGNMPAIDYMTGKLAEVIRFVEERHSANRIGGPTIGTEATTIAKAATIGNNNDDDNDSSTRDEHPSHHLDATQSPIELLGRVLVLTFIAVLGVMLWKHREEMFGVIDEAFNLALFIPFLAVFILFEGANHLLTHSITSFAGAGMCILLLTIGYLLGSWGMLTKAGEWLRNQLEDRAGRRRLRKKKEENARIVKKLVGEIMKGKRESQEREKGLRVCKTMIM
jgi:hypothetical protein